jgi:hypothetical protein
VPTDPGPSSCPYSPTTYTPPAPLLRALCGLQTVLTAVFTKIELISQRGSPTKRGNVRMAHYRFGPKRGLLVQSWPTESSEIRPLGMAPIHHLRAILYSIQHPERGHGGSARWAFLSPCLCGFSRFLLRYS